ncbi:MAG: hypothetical protein V2J62_10240 [candidate division KSB1 bacterium]|nr:hypothetical protein [candidate division KSB1 bacterium]
MSLFTDNISTDSTVLVKGLCAITSLFVSQRKMNIGELTESLKHRQLISNMMSI